MSKVKFIATEIAAKDLQPGDLFSGLGPDYWNRVDENTFEVGEKVYARTNNPSSYAVDRDLTVFKITMEFYDPS